MATPEAKVQSAKVIQNDLGQWRVQLIGGNNEIIFWSENYINEAYAVSLANEFSVPVTIEKYGEENG